MDYSKSSYITSLWSIQEALLQSYRTMFITIQSIFIAASLALLGMESFDYTLLIPIFIIGLYVNVSWLEVTSRRGLYVHFLQTLLKRYDTKKFKHDPDHKWKKKEPFERFIEFQKKPEYRNSQMNAKDFIVSDSTRASLGSIIPALFFFYWFFLAVYITCFSIIVTDVYFSIVNFYIWVAIATLSAGLLGNIVVKMIRQEKNIEYKMYFLRWCVVLAVVFPGLFACVHSQMPFVWEYLATKLCCKC